MNKILLSFRIKNKLIMEFSMFRCSHNHKIFNSIINWIPIDMMNNFIRSKFSTKMFFHYISIPRLMLSAFSCRFSNYLRSASLPSPMLISFHGITNFFTRFFRIFFPKVTYSYFSFMFFGIFSSSKSNTLIIMPTLFRTCLSYVNQTRSYSKRYSTYRTKFIHNISFLLIIISLVYYSTLSYAQQITVTQDVLPNTTSSDSTAVLNNTIRQNANAINSIGGYFNSNGYLTEANGGTGTNLSAFPNGSILVQNTANVGIGTFGQGTSGQILTSGGPAVNPVWITTPVIKTVLFEYTGQVNSSGASIGEVVGTSLNAGAATGSYRYLESINAGYSSLQSWKFIKDSNVNTVTVWTKLWIATGAAAQSQLKVDIGTANGNVAGTIGQLTPEWKSFTIDVSGLVNGSTYDVTASLQDGQGNNGIRVFCGVIMGFGS